MSMSRVQTLIMLAVAVGSLAPALRADPPSVPPEAKHGVVWREQFRLKADLNTVHAVAFAPNSAILATGGDDGTVRLWDVHTGRQTAALRADPRSVAVRALAFSPDGKTLVAGMHTTPPRLVFWDIATKRPRRIVQGTSATSLAFSPDGKTLATGAFYYLLKLWDVTTGKERLTLRRPRGGIGIFHQLCFSPDGKLVATGFGNEYPSTRFNGEIDLWDAATGTQRLRFENRVGIDALAFSPDGRMLASGGRHDYRVTLWEVASGRPRAILQLPNRGHLQCFAVAFAPDGKTLAAGCRSMLGTESANERIGVILWDVITRRHSALLKGDGDILFSLAFAPNGKMLAAGSGTGTVTVWQAVEPRPTK